MPQPHNTLLREHEGRLELAIEALYFKRFKSQRAAARAFNVKQRVLSARVRGTPFILERAPNVRKLTLTEEQTIV